MILIIIFLFFSVILILTYFVYDFIIQSYIKRELSKKNLKTIDIKATNNKFEISETNLTKKLNKISKFTYVKGGASHKKIYKSVTYFDQNNNSTNEICIAISIFFYIPYQLNFRKAEH